MQGNDTVADLTSVSASGATRTNAGTATNVVTAGLENNYTVTTANGTLTINKAAATVTANSDTGKVYNGSAQSVSGFTATGLVNGETVDVLSGVSAGASGTNAGSYVSVASGSDDNYDLTFVNGSLVIAKAALTVTGNSATGTYSGHAQSVSGFTVRGLQGNDTVADLTSVSASGATRTNAGTATNVVTAGLENNYIVTTANGTLTINKAAATVTANSDTGKVYNGSAQSVSGFTATGLVNGETVDVLSGVSAGASGTNAGSYVSVASGSDDNYDLTFVNGSLVIAKAALTVTGNSFQRELHRLCRGRAGQHTWGFERPAERYPGGRGQPRNRRQLQQCAGGLWGQCQQL
ncbi:MAG: hypothetical protein C4K60_06290 [Ideonella sp. MAG2]|nr:MAG: hypothetical protein C4K60_06290 [Ideonella sp. MAG2]